MSPVERPTAPVLASQERLLSGWGRTAPSRAHVVRPRNAQEVTWALERAAQHSGGTIARGAGRSYGDAAQNGGGSVLDMTGLRGVARLDPERGEVVVAAGTKISELLRHLSSRGLTLPVVPGTRFLTVGGALAADVHGKNHPQDGSLARHVSSLMLSVPGGQTLELSTERDRDLFDATLGGMGLTGVILEATLRTMPLHAAHVLSDIDRTDSLAQAITLMSGDRHRYAIAWIDMLAEGAAYGRSVVTRSIDCPGAEAAQQPQWRTRAGAQISDTPRLHIPASLSRDLLRPAAMRAFNALRWRSAPRRARERPVPASANLFPLDAVGSWNLLYGPAGLLQYQFALPTGRESTLLEVVGRLRQRRLPVYLAVLKRLGPGSDGPLSFPIEGWTLALDLPGRAPGLREELDRIDELVASAGGRVYLAKDARLRADTLAAMYPRLERFLELRARVDPDGVLRSDMARRLGLDGTRR